MGDNTSQRTTSVLRYARASLAILGIILAPGTCVSAQPADLLRKVAERESLNEAARNEYTYRQTVVIADLDKHGAQQGEYREVRDVTFTPARERVENTIGKPRNSLKLLKLTEEDFRDIREIQPLLITRDNAFLYEWKFGGEETIDGVECWVLRVRPRQILQGQRFFDGTLWVSRGDLGVVRMEGEAVPQVRTVKNENLFPRFTTLREKFEGKFWFPVKTLADDTLWFKSGPVRTKMTIEYADYRRFAAESTVTYK